MSNVASLLLFSYKFGGFRPQFEMALGPGSKRTVMSIAMREQGQAAMHDAC
jgi:hypothetical protein